MKLILDTHTFLWFVNGDLKLSAKARLLIEDLNNERYVSMATIWEMAIKNGLGKLPLAQPIEIFIPSQMQLNRMDVLPIHQEHAFHAAQLPLHHRDPFDRMLIAQSVIEGIPLLSADTALDAYAGVVRLW